MKQAFFAISFLVSMLTTSPTMAISQSLDDALKQSEQSFNQDFDRASRERQARQDARFRERASEREGLRGVRVARFILGEDQPMVFSGRCTVSRRVAEYSVQLSDGQFVTLALDCGGPMQCWELNIYGLRAGTSSGATKCGEYQHGAWAAGGNLSEQGVLSVRQIADFVLARGS